MLLLGIDSGTQGTKVVVLDSENGRIVAESYASHALRQESTGMREQDPDWWIEALTAAITAVFADDNIRPRDVVAIGVSGQQHGFVPLDKSDNVIRAAKLWCDTETAPEAASLTARMGGEKQLINSYGNSIAAGFTASKIAWLKQHEPENYAKLATILLPHDYINYWLTGEKTMEYGDASGTAFFDVRRRVWADDVLNAIDDSGKLQRCLPRLIEASEPNGRIRGEIADLFDFNKDVIVSAGGGDNMMAAIGTGNVEAGIVTASLGTSGTIYSFSETPICDPGGELAAFCSSDGHWLPLVCTMNVTVATELTRKLFAAGVNALDAHVAKAEIGAGGMMLLPYFNGERTPALPNAKATLFGIDSINYTPENMCRAAMEGATFGLRYGLDVLRQQGINPKEIRLVGGGSKSQNWRQIVADIFGCAVICPEIGEAGALGAALQALWCFESMQTPGSSLPEMTRRFVTLNEGTRTTPNPDSVQKYETLFQRYLQLDGCMRSLYS